MLLLAQTHEFSNQDAIELRDLGYRFEGIVPGKITDAFNDFAPNFNLLELALQLETILNGIAQPIERTVRFIISANPVRLEVCFRSNDPYHTESGFAMERTFYYVNGRLEVRHDYLTIPETFRNAGLVKLILQKWLQQYINMNVSKIKVHATRIGGYVWARLHFTADYQDHMSSILASAKKQLSHAEFEYAKLIYESYYDRYPCGFAFPIRAWALMPAMERVLLNSYWEGTIDLQNTTQFGNFTTHVFK
ncbi:hypothetical protein [Flavihumibacter solisilvae]|uniref:Uncharacterized protein n=1 Tax=Flavihumibacter solisilvae TaxID=1349421 RepID=A0A0C1KY77_9BACT|nr:hypothetical protein [Flavihumibacter solisilvae]KIC92652.1 hypothetical protein OI18_21580 [Flavihumibacter solisilvae]